MNPRCWIRIASTRLKERICSVKYFLSRPGFWGPLEVGQRRRQRTKWGDPHTNFLSSWTSECRVFIICVCICRDWEYSPCETVFTPWCNVLSNLFEETCMKENHLVPMGTGSISFTSSRRIGSCTIHRNVSSFGHFVNKYAGKSHIGRETHHFD